MNPGFCRAGSDRGGEGDVPEGDELVVNDGALVIHALVELHLGDAERAGRKEWRPYCRLFPRRRGTIRSLLLTGYPCESVSIRGSIFPFRVTCGSLRFPTGRRRRRSVVLRNRRGRSTARRRAAPPARSPLWWRRFPSACFRRTVRRSGSGLRARRR